MLSRVLSSTGNGYFSQAVSEYARKMKPEEKKEHSAGKSIGEFSEKEWNGMLHKVDLTIEEHKADLKHREKEALDKKKEQAEENVFGKGASGQIYETNVLWDGKKVRSMRFHKIGEEKPAGEEKEEQKLEIMDTISDDVKDEAIQKLIENRKKAPYSMLADENGMITYNGVMFRCDEERNSLCLGDVSDPSQCISVPLEGGGRLLVNRDNIDALSKAIGMFSPEDIRRIMQAIAQDGKIQKIEMEIEDMTSGVEALEKEEE